MLLDLETAVRLAEEIVAERGPDFCYNEESSIGAKCLYVPLSDPRAPKVEPVASNSEVTGCLVGEILTRAGLMTDFIASAQGTIASLMSLGHVPYTDFKVFAFLTTLQHLQDNGRSWGDALSGAKVSVERFEQEV